jgi:hypothetical protein
MSRPIVLACLFLAGAEHAGCAGGGTRDVRATILDESGEPIPGAIFYAEAYDEDGAFAFLSDRAGSAGEVPDSAREPLKIPWRRGARIALAALAPGRPPAVLRDPSGRIESDGALLVQRSAPAGGSSGGGLASLAFPFENDPELVRRLGGSEFAELRAAFLAAYEEIEQSESALSPVQQRKKAVLEALH